MLDIMKDINRLDLFFLRLQTETGVKLVERKSLIIFDEIQFYPKARQAIKHLVADGRYDYIETGSLISIRKNVKDILIPSEEHKLEMFPMDYEEFSWAINVDPNIYQQAFLSGFSMGNGANRTAMRNFRIYMAVGGMPQAVETYIKTNNFADVDKIKKDIIELYKADLRKIDSSGRLSDIFNSIPSQLALGKRRFIITAATKKQKTSKDDERIADLIDSKLVLPCYNVTDPGFALSQTKDVNNFKLYLFDTGLFVTMLFADGKGFEEDIYKKLLSDKLELDKGYLYENMVAQIIASNNHNLYFHTWKNEEKKKLYEIDFLLSYRTKVIPIEVKSSKTRKHDSMDEFVLKYSSRVGERYLISNKDVSSEGMLRKLPLYMFPFLMKTI